MKNPFNSFETLTEQGKNLAKPIQNQVKSQLGASNSQQQPSSSDAAAGLGQDKATQDFVNDLYGTNSQQKQQPGALPQMSAQQQAIADKQKLEALRKKMHMENYYIPTFEKKKKEETTAERLEREEQEKKQADAKKMELEQKKKEVPKALAKGAERTPGASG